MAPLVKRYYVDEMVVFLSRFFPVFRVNLQLSFHHIRIIMLPVKALLARRARGLQRSNPIFIKIGS
jgi:hypothetical protein